MQHLIEFLIPAYKRYDGVAEAALSVAKQVSANCYENVVRITVVDDASPRFDRNYLVNSLGSMADLVNIESNESNKGMSQNIYDMVSNSRAAFCSVLTDDDWLIDGKLSEIVKNLRSIESKNEVGGLFTPRYSYYETGELNCVECKPFSHDHLIENGPIQAMKHCRNGYILTGFIFRPEYFAREEWFDNIENAYFPVINLGVILSRYSLLFLDRKWFHHTVNNEVHWESWGADEVSQHRRLYHDYMDALSFLAGNFKSKDISPKSKISVSWYEFYNYLREYSTLAIPIFDRFNIVSQRTFRRLAFKFSILFFPVYGVIQVMKNKYLKRIKNEKIH